MSRHNENSHHQGEGVKLVGSPGGLIDLLINDNDLNKWVMEHIVNEGPKHKQVLTALLLKRLHALVLSVENSTGTVFALQKGHKLTSGKEGKGDVLPITIPINPGTGVDAEKIAKAVSKAPEHEVLACAIALQVIEWAIKATSKKNVLIDEQLMIWRKNKY
jgi:hypothetical protein